MSKQTMICPVKFSKAEGEGKENFVTGIASVFGNVDDGGDIVEKGAFVKTISERVPKRLVKFVDSHKWDCAHTLGTVESAKEVENGLYFEASLSIAPSVQDTKIKMLEGHLDKISFGYDVIQDVWERLKDGAKQSVRRLKELKLYEISVCPLAMNEETAILSVKKMQTKDAEETEKDIKIAFENQHKLDEKSFKTINVDSDKGIFAVIGKCNDSECSAHVQSYLFNKDKDWTKEKAIKWVEEHERILSCFGVKEQGLIYKPLMIAEPGKAPLTIVNTYDIKSKEIGLRLALQKQNMNL